MAHVSLRIKEGNKTHTLVQKQHPVTFTIENNEGCIDPISEIHNKNIEIMNKNKQNKK